MIALLGLLLLGQLEWPDNAPLKTPNSEVEDFIHFLQTEPKSDNPLFNEQDVEYIRGFTTYAVPPNLRDDCALQLSFMIHSLTGISLKEEENSGAYYPIAKASFTVEDEKRKDRKVKHLKQVPDSTTLYWVDIRDHNWTQQSWENMTQFDGYMVEPIVHHENNGLLRLLAGNALVRADWFIYNAANSTAQTDKNNKVVSIYRELLYSKNNKPKTVAEFEQAWSLKLNDAQVVGDQFGALVKRSKDVAIHNRYLFGYRTYIGWYYRTYDVKFQTGERNYLDSAPELRGNPPKVYDGGEIFSSNPIHLQVYDLYDAKDNLADFADATIVRHLTDVFGDARVRVAHSCMDCHSAGPIPSENAIAELVKNGYFKLPYKGDKLRLERSFLNDKFNKGIKEHQALYEEALSEVNGLKPAENLVSYNKVVLDYKKDVDLKRAAFECGLTPEQFKAKLKAYKGRLMVDLGLLIQDEGSQPIPRDIWEDNNTDGRPGAFQQAMIALNGLTTIKEVVYFVTRACECKIGEKVLTTIPANAIIEYTGETQGQWCRVRYQRFDGWIPSEVLGKR